jgi:hypothetical protein
MTHAYVCPVCGVVYEYEMVPSYVHLTHVAPLERESTAGKLDIEVVERAKVLFGEKVARELAKLDRVQAEEILTALEVIVSRRNYSVSWKAIRKAVDIAAKHKLKVNFEAVRERRVKEEIERFVRENQIQVDPREVWYFAVRNKNLWAGRKAATLAKVFTYLYCKRKGIDININIPSRILKLAEALNKVIR